MIVVGCDPGLTGALCFIGRGWQEIVDIPTCENGQTTGSMKRWVDVGGLTTALRNVSHRWQLRDDDLQVFIERPIAMATLPAQTIAAQFDTFGVLRACLARHGAVHCVNPREWKKIFGLGADKDKAREIASNLYPALVPMLKRVKDHNRAEAVLIAHYGLKEMA